MTEAQEKEEHTVFVGLSYVLVFLNKKRKQTYAMKNLHCSLPAPSDCWIFSMLSMSN